MHFAIKSINYIQTKLNMKKLISYSAMLIFISFILSRLYGNVFDSIGISYVLFILTLFVKVLKNTGKLNKIVKLLHLTVILIAIIIPILMLLNLPRYTLKKATSIVKEDMVTKVGANIEAEIYSRRDKTGKGNLFVSEDYMMQFKYKENTYIYIFDPLTGKYSCN